MRARAHNNIKRLSGKFAGHLRYRIGDWRVIYRIDDQANRVLVLAIALAATCMTNNNRNNRLKEIEVEGSSGNVFADLGVANRLPTPPWTSR